MAAHRTRRLNSLLDLRTSLQTHLRALPGAEGQELMNAYMTVKKMQLLENQLIALNKRKRRAEETLRRLMHRLGDTKLKDLISEVIARSQGASQDGERCTAEDPPKNQNRPFKSVKLGY